MPEGHAVTRDHARKKAIRAQMAASAEPYSVAARKAAGAEQAGEAARHEVVARAAATLAASSARLEMRKVPGSEQAEGATVPEDLGSGPGPVAQLAFQAAEFVLLRVTAAGRRFAAQRFAAQPPVRAAVGDFAAVGVIEPAARRFYVRRDADAHAWVYVRGRHYYGRADRHSDLTGEASAAVKPGPSGVSGNDPLEPLRGLPDVTSTRHMGGPEHTVLINGHVRKIQILTDPAAAFGDDPLELLMRLQDVTSARCTGEETVRETLCRAFTVSSGGAEHTVWADKEHIRKVKTVTRGPEHAFGAGTFGPGLTMRYVETKTVELWEFGFASDSLDWTRFSPPTA